MLKGTSEFIKTHSWWMSVQADHVGQWRSLDSPAQPLPSITTFALKQKTFRVSSKQKYRRPLTSQPALLAVGYRSRKAQETGPVEEAFKKRWTRGFPMHSQVHWHVERCPECWGVLTFPTAFASRISPSALAQHRGTAKGPRITFGLEGTC